MKTLFLNPNSSAAATALLHQLVARGGWPPSEWEVRCLAGAPELITCEADNIRSEALLLGELAGLAAMPQRVVLMSSLDTGLGPARRLLGARACGFTRSVFAWHRLQGGRLQVITFGAAMTPLYEQVFRADGNAGMVECHTVLDSGPSQALADSARLLDQLRRSCEALAARSDTPLFIVGVAALQLGLRLRDEGFDNVVDPVADLLQFLQRQP